MIMKNLLHIVVVGLALTALALGAAGCFDPFSPRIAVTQAIAEARPSPLSPTGVIQLWQWAYRHRDINAYKELFTADYTFVFATLDPAGEQYKGTPWTRDDELASTTHLFVGGSATEEPATSITLDFGNELSAIPERLPSDSTGLYHMSVSVEVVLDVQRPSSSLQVKGNAVLHVVRGDIAKIPKDLNLQPDPLRWYIWEWDDYTNQGSSPQARAHPVGGDARVASAAAARPAAPAVLGPTPVYPVSFGAVKVAYRSP